MKYMLSLLLVLIGCFLGGCSKSAPPPTIEEEIAALPDVWNPKYAWGVTSNNWIMLDKVKAITNEVDKIRLVKILLKRFQHDPNWYLNHLEETRDTGLIFRHMYARNAILALTMNKESSPEAILTGWKLLAELHERMDLFKAATQKIYDMGRPKWEISNVKGDQWHFAWKIRDMNEMYFKYQFAGEVYHSYKYLPEEYRPTFVEQIKRDFFHRPEMKFVDKNRLPAPFRTPLDVNAVQ